MLCVFFHVSSNALLWFLAANVLKFFYDWSFAKKSQGHTHETKEQPQQFPNPTLLAAQ